MDSSRAGRRPWSRARTLLAAALVASVGLASPARADEKVIEEGSLGAAIRDAGYSCARVTDMKRSEEGVAEGLTVWVVRCNSGEYRVTFKGDTGSEVVRLD